MDKNTPPMVVWVFHFNQQSQVKVIWLPPFLATLLEVTLITPWCFLHWELHTYPGSQARKQKINKAACNACETCSLRSGFGKYNSGRICMARPPLIHAYWYMLYSMKLTVYLAKSASLEFQVWAPWWLGADSIWDSNGMNSEF